MLAISLKELNVGVHESCRIFFNIQNGGNFEKVIEKAMKACENAGEKISDHFADISKTIPMPKGASKTIDDIALTRCPCYLIAQNGDPTKSEVAFAQTYFAVQTRKQKIIDKRLLDIARVSAR